MFNLGIFSVARLQYCRFEETTVYSLCMHGKIYNTEAYNVLYDSCICCFYVPANAITIAQAMLSDVTLLPESAYNVN